MTYPDKTFINQLIGFGLSEKEAVIYLVAVDSGISTARQLSKSSGINRSTTYVAVESLVQKGLIKSFKNPAGINVYEAYEPTVLMKKASQMEKRHAKICREIEAIIPKLTALSPLHALRPRLTTYEGKAGIQTALHDIMTTGDDVRAFAVKPDIPYYKRGQKIQAISPYRGNMNTASRNILFSVAFVPANKYDFSSDILICDNKIVLISEREGFAALIEDRHFAEVMKETFDLAWEQAKRLNAQRRR